MKLSQRGDRLQQRVSVYTAISLAEHVVWWISVQCVYDTMCVSASACQLASAIGTPFEQNGQVKPR